jgi:3-deoxy-D-manno-octulosonic acid kinase
VSAAAALPAGYLRRRLGPAELVARADAAAAVAAAVATAGTLYEYAARHPGRRTMAGRAPVYAAPLPDGRRVVVRHSRHGGLLAPLTGDLFVRPGRAPAELAASTRLGAAGVPTPEIVAYLLYPAGALLCRIDVASAEIADADDLGAVLADPARARDTAAWLPAVATLLAALARAGAHHADLNVKNVLLARSAARPTGYVLDVDRVRFGEPGDPRIEGANAARLLRSARKRRAAGLAEVTDEALAELSAATRRARPDAARGVPAA